MDNATERELIFQASIEDMYWISMIVTRGLTLAQQHGVQLDHLTAAMDITVVHCNTVPLKLAQMAMSGDEDFSHDFLGIGMHIDRKTGMLKNDFKLRFAVKKH